MRGNKDVDFSKKQPKKMLISGGNRLKCWFILTCNGKDVDFSEEAKIKNVDFRSKLVK